MLDAYLADLEERIDPAVEDVLLADWLNFSLGTNPEQNRRGLFSPRRAHSAPPRISWPRVWINDTLDNFELMALQQFRECSEMLAHGSGSMMTVRCNYGTGIMPSLFGAELFIMDRETDTLPTTRPLPGGRDAIKALLDRGVPDLHHSLGGKVFAMGEQFREIIQRYPKLARSVHLYHPDMQGPIDICELLWGSSIFYDLVDTPDLVKALLELVTETYIQFMRAWSHLEPYNGQWSTHWGLLHRGRIMLRDDSAMNLSPGMFNEFIEPYDRRLLAEFGGGAIHFCGHGDHYIQAMANIPGLYAINLTQPELNDMDIVYNHTVDKGIRILGLDRKAAEAALAAGRNIHGSIHIA
jgi:hypothetical protein